MNRNDAARSSPDEGGVGRTDGGDRLDVVVARAYEELRGVARRLMEHQRSGHTLEATALVHEAYLRIARAGDRAAGDRSRFIALAAATMRSVLVDHARTRGALKRGRGRGQVLLNERVVGKSVEPDLLALDEALARLSRTDDRKAKVVELRYFIGLSLEEAAQVLGISLATVKRDWTMAKAWLHRELTGESPHGDA